MVHFPKNPCPAVTDAAVSFFWTVGSLFKTAATSETTKKTVAAVGQCLSGLYQCVRHSACMERCIKRMSKEDATKTITVVDQTGEAQQFPVAPQPSVSVADGAKKQE